MCVYVLTDFICAYLTAVLCEVRKYFYALSQLPHLIYMKLDTDPFSEMIDLFWQILGFRRLIVEVLVVWRKYKQGQTDTVVERFLEAASTEPIYIGTFLF